MAFCRFSPLSKDFDKYKKKKKKRLDFLSPREGGGAPETLFKISVLLQRVFLFWLFVIPKYRNGVVFNTAEPHK